MLILTAAGLLMAISFAGMAYLRDLQGHIVPFLALNGLAWMGYAAAVWWLLPRTHHWQQRQRSQALLLVLGLGVLFRLTLLVATPPTLSDDVYRYMWDGRLFNAGINPYAFAVDSAQLDALDSPQRALVNHSWMASPYLPVAQALFALVYRLAPGNALAFQVLAALLDFLTGCLVIGLLSKVGLPKAWALIYLWNPLAVVEFAHGAHVDAVMGFLVIAALWLWTVVRREFLSVVALAAATLTKGVPALLLPVLARRWGWRHALVFLAVLTAACLPFALGAGWGLTGPLDGTGLFGALRIYARQWNYNSSLYHLLEVAISGYNTPGPVPPEVVGSEPILASRLIVTATLAVVLIAVWRAGRRGLSHLELLRLALVPLIAYLMLTTTVHPWYLTLTLPLLPFLLSRPGRASRSARFLWPCLYLSAAVSLSYLTYLDPANLREYEIVRLIEYSPFYLLLVWAAWPTIFGGDMTAGD